MSYVDLSQDLGLCPECEENGRHGHLFPAKAVNKASGEELHIAVCSLDQEGNGTLCGYRAKMFDGGLALSLDCEGCGIPMHQVLRNDGGKSWACTTSGCTNRGWHVADAEWSVVDPPLCLECLNPMKFWFNKKRRSHSWACFDHQCYRPCDKFGRIIHRRPSRSKGGKAL